MPSDRSDAQLTEEEGVNGHTFDTQGRVRCHAWDEVIDFELDPWDEDEPCPWCGEEYEETIINDYRE